MLSDKKQTGPSRKLGWAPISRQQEETRTWKNGGTGKSMKKG
jgi:hypothetical protein